MNATTNTTTELKSELSKWCDELKAKKSNDQYDLGFLRGVEAVLAEIKRRESATAK
jgi:hypothetical protein